MAVISYNVVDDEIWLSRRGIARILDVTDGTYVPEKDEKDSSITQEEETATKPVELVKEA